MPETGLAGPYGLRTQNVVSFRNYDDWAFYAEVEPNSLQLARTILQMQRFDESVRKKMFITGDKPVYRRENGKIILYLSAQESDGALSDDLPLEDMAKKGYVILPPGKADETLASYANKPFDTSDLSLKRHPQGGSFLEFTLHRDNALTETDDGLINQIYGDPLQRLLLANLIQLKNNIHLRPSFYNMMIDQFLHDYEHISTTKSIDLIDPDFLLPKLQEGEAAITIGLLFPVFSNGGGFYAYAPPEGKKLWFQRTTPLANRKVNVLGKELVT